MSFNLADLYEAVADADPDREVVVVGDRRLTYRQLEERANRLANHLASAGVGPGDPVGLQLVNSTEYLTLVGTTGGSVFTARYTSADGLLDTAGPAEVFTSSIAFPFGQFCLLIPFVIRF